MSGRNATNRSANRGGRGFNPRGRGRGGGRTPNFNQQFQPYGMPNYQFGGGGPFFPNGGYGFNGFGAGFGGDYYGPGSQYGFDPNVASPALNNHFGRTGNANNNNYIPPSGAEDINKGDKAADDGLVDADGFTAPGKKHLIKTDIDDAKSTPKKTKTTNKFSALSDEGNVGEEMEIEELNDNESTKGENGATKSGSRGKKSPKRGGNKGKGPQAKRIKQSNEEDLESIIEEEKKKSGESVHWEGDTKASGNSSKSVRKTSSRKGGKGNELTYNNSGQFKLRLSAPTNLQCTSYVKIRNRIQLGKKVTSSELAEVNGEYNKISLLASTATLKVMDHAGLNEDNINPDLAHDFIKFMSVENIFLMFNRKDVFNAVYSKLAEHNQSYSLANSSPKDFPFLFDEPLTTSLDSGELNTNQAREIAIRYLERFYPGEQNRIQEYVDEVVSDEDIIEQIKKPGALTSGISKSFGLHPSGTLPYRIDLDKLPVLCSKSWKKVKEPASQKPPADAQEQQNPFIAQTEDKPLSPPKPKSWGFGNNHSTEISCHRVRLQYWHSSTKAVTGDPSSYLTAFQNMVARYIKGAEDAGHCLSILPFNEKPDCAPITEVSTLMSMTHKTLQNYTGTVVYVKDTTNWRSFEFKIETSLVRPHCICRRESYDTAAETPLQAYMREESLSIVSGDRWTTDTKPILLLRGSHPADEIQAIKDEILMRLGREKVEVDPSQFDLEWHEFTKTRSQPTEDITAGGLCVVTTLIREDEVRKIFKRFEKLHCPATLPTSFFKPMNTRTGSTHSDSSFELAAQLQGQRDFLRRSIHFTITGVHHQKLDEVPGNPANLNLREAINTKPIRELLLGAKQHQHMSNLPSPILRITHSVANKHVTLLGEEKDVEEMRILAPRIVEKFKIWGCSNATLDPTPIESENMRNPPMSTPRQGAFAPSFNPPTSATLQPSGAPLTSPTEKSANDDPQTYASLVQAINVITQGQTSLAKEINQLKELMQAQQNPPSQVSDPQMLISDLSSISSKLTELTKQVSTPQILPSNLMDQLTKMVSDLVQNKSKASELDQIILRSHIHDSQLLRLPDDARESEILLPMHGYEDMAMHRHSRDEEFRLKSLPPAEMVKLVAMSPCYVRYDNHICPTCQEFKLKADSMMCAVCEGYYHEECQALQLYRPSGYAGVYMCSFCTQVLHREISVQLMLDCDECLGWARKKKEEIRALVTDRVREERLDNLRLRKMDSLGDYILGIIRRTENDIEYIKGNGDQPNTQNTASKVGFHPNPATAEFDGKARFNHAHSPETPANTTAPTPEVNSADHSYIDGQLTTPLPVNNINIQSAAKENSGSEDSSEDEELAIETLAKSIRKYRDDVATLYDSSIRDAVNSKIYDLQSGWWTKRLDALTKGIEVFETEINSGAAGNATVDILYSNNDDDECDQYIPGLDRLRSAHSMYWAFDTNDECKSICPFHQSQFLWWKENKIQNVYGADKCCDDKMFLSKEELIRHLTQHQHWVARPIVLSLIEYSKLTGGNMSEPHIDDKDTDIDSPAKPNALFHQQTLEEAKEEDFVDYDGEEEQDYTAGTEDNAGENQSINSALEQALEASSSVDIDTSTTKNEPRQKQKRSDQSIGSGSDLSSDESDEDSAAERHRKQSEKRTQTPEAKEAVRRSKRVAELGKQTGRTTASRQRPKKSVSDISDDSESDSEID